MIKKVMKKYQRKLEAKVKEDEGSLLAKAYTGMLELSRPLYFKDEFLLLNGLKPNSDSKQQSILFFTVHKSASTFIKHTVMDLLAHEKLAVINFSGYLSKKKQEAIYNNPGKMEKLLKEKGYFYGAFRAYYEFPDTDRFKILLVLRDPRDVLNSYYFSTLYNHPLGRKEVFEERNQYAGMDIDTFVIHKAPEFKRKYKDFCENLLHKPNVVLLRYEDMIGAFAPWLNKLSDFLELRNNEDVKNAIIEKTSFKVKKEDKHSFIRSIKAKDYKEKLKPETIAQLNIIFKDELLQLGYDLD